MFAGPIEFDEPDTLCRFCRLALAIHHRIPTIFGTSDLCDDCLGEYREQVARAVDNLNRVGSCYLLGAGS